MLVNTVMKELWDLFKRNFAILLIGALFLFLYFGSCNKAGTTHNTSDTTTHTTQVPQPIIVMPPYQPQQAGQTIYVPIPQSSQGVIPATTIEGLVAQVKDLSIRIESLGTKYYAIKNYEDSIQLKDTAGLRVGVVNLKQVVSENTLQSTQPTYQLYFPHTVTTITNIIYPKPRNKVFLGIGAEASLNIPALQSLDIGIALQNKRDNILQLSATYNLPAKSPGIRLAYYPKIHLGK